MIEHAFSSPPSLKPQLHHVLLQVHADRHHSKAATTSPQTLRSIACCSPRDQHLDLCESSETWILSKAEQSDTRNATKSAKVPIALGSGTAVKPCASGRQAKTCTQASKHSVQMRAMIKCTSTKCCTKPHSGRGDDRPAVQSGCQRSAE